MSKEDKVSKCRDCKYWTNMGKGRWGVCTGRLAPIPGNKLYAKRPSTGAVCDVFKRRETDAGQ